MISQAKFFSDLLSSAKGILLTAHRDPDLDAVGSTLGVWHLCRLLGIPATVWLSDPLPKDCDVLPGADRIVRTLPTEGTYDQVWVLDASNIDRIRDVALLKVFAAGRTLVNVDHHPDNSQFGQHNLTPIISSTSELVFWTFLHASGGALLADVATDKQTLSDMATCLYAGVCFDTGRFLHDSVTANTFRAVADLVTYGADLALIRHHFFENKSPANYALMRYVLNHMVVSPLGYIYVEIPVSMDEAEMKSVDIIRDMEGTSVALSFRETVSDGIKVSLRSKSDFNVSLFAAQFGGGGHVKASGITLRDVSLSEAKTRVLAALETALSRES
jgi:bifunctional oligoribonuclease and PAP phosphatase NrnA